ncbi:36.4 kDa proline-rich protein-like [Populus alba x Populus x berolinensis]|nr:36.4 kDa proline-rich protein-like [Populus alba x Populus x berolinensis]
MSASVSAISSKLVKKAIPFSTPNSTVVRTLNRKIIKSHVYGKPGLISPVCRLRVHNQSNIPPEIPGKNPPEFPRRSNNNEYPPSVPPEVPELPSIPEIETSPPDEGYIRPPRIPELPNPGPDFPVPPLPTPPDVPLPPPGTPWPPPPDRLPPKLPPDIIPPPAPPPPDIGPPLDTPDIKPPPGPYVV